MTENSANIDYDILFEDIKVNNTVSRGVIKCILLFPSQILLYIIIY